MTHSDMTGDPHGENARSRSFQLRVGRAHGAIDGRDRLGPEPSYVAAEAAMKAVRVHQSGGLDAMIYEDVQRPVAGRGQVLVRVHAAGVGPWDAWVRAGQSALKQALPLTLGSDIAGTVETVGEGVRGFAPGDAVFGVTNAQFTGAYAEFAVAEVDMIARKPRNLSYVEAASVPVVATTAWQLVHDHGRITRGQRVLVQGAAGNVGAYAVQLAKKAGAHVIGAARAPGIDRLDAMGADSVIDVDAYRFEDRATNMDVVLDTVGGEILDRSLDVVRRGGVIASAVSQPDPARVERNGLRSAYFLVSVTTAVLSELAGLLDSGELKVHVGDVLPLSQARLAHEMLAGKPHKPGKIVLAVRVPGG